MTERENFFIAYNHGIPQWVPNFYEAYAPMGASLLNNQGEYMKGGLDMFGAKWICTEDTGWQAIPDPFYHVFEDITEWEKYIHFPDLDSMDWEAAARRDLSRIDRKEKVVACFGMEGNFNRLQSLMGTCEALIAMLEEPEAVYAFFDAYTSFKMKTIEKIAKYYKPDIYVNGDDVCSGDGLFFSKDMYNQLIKPFEIKLGHKALEYGMIVEHHVCGNAQAILPDILETGATIWQTAQIMNDLKKIKKEYGHRLLIHGGWDSTGPHSFVGASEAIVREATRKALDDYAADGNFALFPIVMGDPENPEIANRRAWVCDECRKYSNAMYKQ